MKLKFDKELEIFTVTESSKTEYYKVKEHLTRHKKNYRYDPRFKFGIWDGKDSLFNKGVFSMGLWHTVYQLCKKNNFTFEIENKDDFPRDKTITLENVTEFCEYFFKTHVNKKNEKFYPYSHQIEVVFKTLKHKYCLVEVATGGGKSLIFSIVAFYILKNINPKAKFLLIVPNISLVTQFYDDIKNYNNGYNNSNKNPLDIKIQEIMSDKPRVDEGECNFFIGTFQSLEKYDKSFFEQFYSVTTDECLHPDTEISMYDDTFKKISEIKIGDLVKTINEKNGDVEIKPVDFVYKNLSKFQQMYEVEFDNSILKVTGNHKVRLKTQWKRVDELNENDDIKIKKIDYVGDVFNLRIKDTDENINNHNYLANGICVSNCHKSGAKNNGDGIKQVVKVLKQTFGHAQYRFGLSGTYPNDDTLDYINIESLHGHKIAEVVASDLMDKGIITNVKIKCVLLEYNDIEFANQISIIRKGNGKGAYDIEKKFILESDIRLEFVYKNIISKVKNNTIILFHIIEYGKKIFEYLKSNMTNEIFYIDGETSKKDREEIKKRLEEKSDTPKFLVGSFGCLSTGVSINNLHIAILMESYKSEQVVIQTIGRVLRLDENKNVAYVFDIVDVFDKNERSRNALYRHYLERKQFYINREYTFDEKWINLNK